MATSIQSPGDSNLHQRLLMFRSRAWKIITGQSLLWMFAGLIIVAAVVMWIDTIWALPAQLRWGVSRPGLMLFVWVGAVAIFWRRRSLTDEFLARRIDHNRATGGEVLTGLQLATGPIQPSGPLSQSMAEIATRRSAELALQTDPTGVFPSGAMRQSGWVFSSVLAGAMLLYAIAPQVVGHQVSRFMFPYADIPPYTGVVIDLDLEREQLFYGQDLRVGARVTHGSLRSGAHNQMMLVSVSQEGYESVLPMLSQEPDKWQAMLTRVTGPVTVFARSGDSVSRKSHIDVIMTPQILTPHVTIVPPEYTRRAAYQGKIPERGISGLSGTKVAWRVPSNRQLAHGRLSMTYDDDTREEIRLEPSDNADASPGIDAASTLVAGQSIITKSGAFKLTVVDVDGIESSDAIEGAITVIADQRPVVRITAPQPMSLATPDIELPVTVDAEDDYGLSSLTLFRSINGSPASPVRATIDSTPRQQAHWKLPLNQYRVQPGDEIQLFARAEDNDPQGVKGAESPVTVIRIIATQEFQEMMLRRRGAESMQAKYQQARRNFEQLGAALREVQEAQKELAAAADLPPDEQERAQQELAQKLAAAQQKAQEAAQAIEKLSRQAMPIDIDQELVKQFDEMAELASEMGKQLEQMQSPAGEQQTPLSDAESAQIEEMMRQTSAQQEQLTESAIEPMKTMQKLLPLLVAEQRFTQLVGQQRDLAERINALQSTASADDEQTQRRIAELESEQQQLRDALDDLLDDIEHHAGQLGDEPELQKMRQTALEFVEAVRASQAMSEMAAAQTGLLENKHADAAADAAKAADILESFLSQCNSMGDSACKNCQAAFKPSGCKMGNSIEQMMNMMGMKPGSSGNRPGGSPGLGMGWGAGGGYAQRFPGQQNVGLYGAIAAQSEQPRQGNGAQSNGGSPSAFSMATPTSAEGEADGLAENNAGGQAASAVPSEYRSRVAEYYRTLVETMGSVDNETSTNEQ